MAQAIADQFERTWAQLREAIELVPAGQWRRSEQPDDPFLTPSRHVLHLVETVDFYLCAGPREFPKDGRFGVDWESAAPEKLPTREAMFGYLDEVRERLDLRLHGLAENDLVGASPFHWTGKNVAEHWMYALRHNQHHVAVINTILRLRGLKRAEWR